MKKLISIILAGICMIALVGCGNDEIQMTKEVFPQFEGTDFEGNVVNNDMFKDYEATIVNFWNNGCGSCIEEMPELEAYYQDFKEKNINLISVAVSACESDEMRSDAEDILKEKGVTFTNVIPQMESDFYKKFIGDIAGYPMTYIVDSEGYMIGAPIVGVVKNQEDILMKRLENIKKSN